MDRLEICMYIYILCKINYIFILYIHCKVSILYYMNGVNDS